MVTEYNVLRSIVDRQNSTNHKVERANVQRRAGITDLSSNEYIRTINTRNPYVQTANGGVSGLTGNAGAIASYFMQHVTGATLEGIAGVMGNFQIESNFDPHAIQGGLAYNAVWANSPQSCGYAFGIAQWDCGRRVNLINYANSKGKDWFDLTTQLEFALNQEGSDSQILKDILTKSTSVAQATSDFLTQWERGTTASLSSRQNAATAIFNQIGSANSGSGGMDTSYLDQALGRIVGHVGLQCYGLAQYWAEHLGSGALNTTTATGGTGRPSPAVAGMAAANIPYDFPWGSGAYSGFTAHKGSVSPTELQAGDILCLIGGQTDAYYGHVVVVKAVTGGKIYCYTQNPNPLEIPTWTVGDLGATITGYVRPKQSTPAPPITVGQAKPVYIPKGDDGTTTFYIRISQDMIFSLRWGMKFQIMPYYDSDRTYPIIMHGDVKITINDIDFTPFFKAQYNGKWISKEPVVYPDNGDRWYDVMQVAEHLTETEINSVFSAGMKKITFKGDGIFNICTILDLKYSHANR